MRYAYRVEDIRRAEEGKGEGLMQQAAFAIASRCADLLTDLAGRVYGSRVLVLVGPGANGGDALYAGAHLASRGAQVLAYCTHDRWHEGGMRTFRAAHGQLVTSTDLEVDLVIDGIFGMGARGSLEQALEFDSFVVSVDLPSGVDPDSGAISGPHITADLTLATGALKAAHLVDPARHACGIVEVIDLGLEIESPVIEAWQTQDVNALLDQHDLGVVDLDKYRRGVLGLLAGSSTYPGAGVLAAHGAVGMGVGMIRSFGVSELLDEMPEVVHADGQVQALALGPGLTEEFQSAVEDLLSREVPAVIDAGATQWVSNARPNTVITPHAGELARLLGVERSEIEAHRLHWVRKAVAQLGVNVLLKGSTTLIASPDGRVVANPTGSPALATAGSGDVLTGMIGALLARGVKPFEAAVVGAWVHGMAGAYAQSGASAIAEMVPVALAAVAEDSTEYSTL